MDVVPPRNKSKQFTLITVGPPRHWRALPLHDVSEVYSVKLGFVGNYFSAAERIGGGLYGDVYAVRLAAGSSEVVPAFSGLSETMLYALKMVVITVKDIRVPLPGHASPVTEVEVNTVLRRSGVDMTHFVPLLAWTRWYIDASEAPVLSDNPFTKYANKHVQLMLFPYVTGLTLERLYSVSDPSAPPKQMPSVALANNMPAATPVRRALEAIACSMTQMLCMLHLMRAAGLEEMVHYDLHHNNIMVSKPAHTDIKVLVYQFTADAGMPNLVVPLGPTHGGVLRIIDFDSARLRYTAADGRSHQIFTMGGSGAGRSHAMDFVQASYVIATRFLENETADVKSVLSANPGIKQITETVTRLNVDSSQVTQPNFYRDMLKELLLCRQYAFDSDSSLMQQLQIFSTDFDGRGTQRYTNLSTGEYRVIVMPDAMRAGPPLPVLL